MRRGELYDEMEATLVSMRAMAAKACHEYNVCPPGARKAEVILGDLLGSFPTVEPPRITPPLAVDYGAHVHLGRRFFANYGLTLLDVAEIRIGNNVFLGPGVQLYTAKHPLEYELRRTREMAEPVTIGDDVWIGGGAIVLPGVNVGSRSVVGAGAVVTKDVPEDVVVAGCPAVVIKRLDRPHGTL